MSTILATKPSFRVVIGLEVHIELKTESKMFCRCPADHFNLEPNTQTCPVCLGLPGALPFPNQQAIKWAILIGLALDCQINKFSKFDRKNYFYPDLPKGYQISQYDFPLGKDGKWKIDDGRWIGIRRVHLEEDTGKLIHSGGKTAIDFNRSGVPLVEIVTEPDFNSAQEVKTFLQKLQQLVRYLAVASADMEKGEMRCEPNVNLKVRKGQKEFYTPIVEIKNVNSFRFVVQAIDYETNRQFDEFCEKGIEKKPGNKETRGWSEEKKTTVPQREKEEAEDYRYFPEPDIPPLLFTQEEIALWQKSLPQLPEEKKRYFVERFHLPPETAVILTETPDLAAYFEEAAKMAMDQGLQAREIANLLVNKKIEKASLTPNEFVKVALARRQTAKVTEEEITKIVEKVIEENQQAVTDFKKGKIPALEFLVGQVTRQTQGKADPNLARRLLAQHLIK